MGLARIYTLPTSLLTDTKSVMLAVKATRKSMAPESLRSSSKMPSEAEFTTSSAVATPTKTVAKNTMPLEAVQFRILATTTSSLDLELSVITNMTRPSRCHQVNPFCNRGHFITNLIKLFRKEGVEEYKKFAKSFVEARSKEMLLTVKPCECYKNRHGSLKIQC
ncbi:hypothetical protein CERZMDRAFT_99726 [Cercospora zeae-maydis SCOH1-5]|uniref:Uncharacterized protein n=1 Tax=Cercospora zeae-maydis SCOH1-5 TaxID=717836 RepID=A0A6A6F9E4_9PEZI|nr:hypothetical protein CERZMDRAFT_99726 [Cercospora zeae-maydis SCOH1-5]